jgi:signal peptidase II
LKNIYKDYLYLFSIAGLIIVIDQITKEIIRQNLASEEIWSPWEWLTPYARLVNWHNFGAAFGMFQNGNTVFAILAIIVSILIILYFPRIPKQDWLLRLALAMQLGGAVGNLIDRLTQGYVTDFISVGRFPVFNVADACISVGGVFLVLAVWLFDQKPEISDKSEVSQNSPENDSDSTPLNQSAAPDFVTGSRTRTQQDD